MHVSNISWVLGQVWEKGPPYIIFFDKGWMKYAFIMAVPIIHVLKSQLCWHSKTSCVKYISSYILLIKKNDKTKNKLGRPNQTQQS